MHKKIALFKEAPDLLSRSGASYDQQAFFLPRRSMIEHMACINLRVNFNFLIDKADVSVYTVVVI
jgi:hypothetical protein